MNELPWLHPARVAALEDALSRRILVIDDNATSREVIARHVRAYGAEPVMAAGAEEADTLLAAGERLVGRGVVAYDFRADPGALVVDPLRVIVDERGQRFFKLGFVEIGE